MKSADFLSFTEAELHELFTALSRLGIFFKDLRDGTNIPNAFWEEWGYTPEEMTGDRWLRALHPEDRERIRRRFEDQKQGRDEISQSEYRIVTRSGNTRWVLSKSVLFGDDANGAPRRMVAIDYDVTAMKEAEREVARARATAESRAREAELLRHAGAAIAATLDRSQAVGRVLQFLADTVPYQTATVQILDGDSLEVVDCSGPVRDGCGPGAVHPLRDHPRYRRILEQGEPELIACPVDEIPELPRGVRADHISWIGVPLGAQGSIIGILTLASLDHDAFTPEHLSLTSSIGDYVALAIQNAQLFEEARRAAITDPLTGAYTRYWFIPYVEREIDAALRDAKPLSLIVIDVDHFKDLNDTYGHPAGDVVLTDLVRTLSGELRASNPLCRLGGEEFAVLLPDVAPAAATAVAERLRDAAAGLSHGCCPDRNVTISLGIAGLGTECRNYDSLFAGAERALYHAKASGRNCARTFESLPQSSR